MKNLNKSKYILATFSSLLLMLIVTTANSEVYPEPGDFAKGAKTWANNCNRCHNLRDPKDLTDDQWITTVFHMRVRAGLTGQQTRDIITFLQQSNNSTPVQKKTSNTVSKAVNSVDTGLTGEQIYTQTCIACHGGNGAGTVPGAPNFPSKNSPLSKSDDELVKNISEGFQTPGSPMAMPAKGGNSKLNEQDVRNVLAYIRGKFGKK